MLAIHPRAPTPRSTSSTLRREGPVASLSSAMSAPRAALALAERPHVRHELVHLLGSERVLEGIHSLRLSLPLEAIQDGLLHVGVADLLLPARGRHVGDGQLRARLRLGLAVDAVAAGALGFPGADRLRVCLGRSAVREQRGERERAGESGEHAEYLAV